MRSFLKKIFLGDLVFSVCGVLSLILWAVWGYFSVRNSLLYENLVDALLYVIVIAGLYIAYKKGETNVQKALTGALLLLLLRSNACMVIVYAREGNTSRIVFSVISLILSLTVLVFHMVLQSDHIGINRAIIFNQLLAALILVLMMTGISQTFFPEGVLITEASFIPACAFTYLYLVCIESRIQEYKRIRAEASVLGKWNEKTRKEAKKLFKLL